MKPQNKYETPDEVAELAGNSPAPAVIRSARTTSKLSQAEAAKLLFVSRSGFIKWESGARAMPAGLYELFLIKTKGKNNEQKRN